MNLPRPLRAAAFALVAGSVAAPALRAQNVGALRERIATIVAAHTDSSGPGALVAVVHRGATVVTFATGAANLDEQIPLGTDSRFYLGSLAKQFTAACIGLLVADGKLSLTDTVGRYVQELPPEVARVPIAHLLHQRSGIRDYLKIRDLNGDRDLPFDNAEALGIIRRQRSLVFAPGSKYQYSNSNYILLAEVVRSVAGKPLADVARERIFAPAGMTATHFETDASEVLPHRVISYRRDGAGAWRRYIKQFTAVGDGGAYASARDLLRWDAILRSRDVLPATVFDVLLNVPAGAGTPYAGGLLIRPFLGEPAIEHGGFMLGFQHHYLRFPRHDVAILVLTNSREIDSFALREAIARAAVEALTGQTLAARPGAPSGGAAPPDAPPSSTFPAVDRRISGVFTNDEIPLQATLAVEDGTLFIHPTTFRRVPMTRTGPRSFTALGGEIGVRLNDTFDTWTLTVRDMGDFEFRRAAPRR